MSLHRQHIGKIGEATACDYLLTQGYSLIQQNYHSKWGELDIICQKDKTIIFVEVKTKVGTLKGKPYEAITASKLSHLKRPIQYFLLDIKYKDFKYRLDVISIVLDTQNQVEELKHFENVETNW